MISVKKFTIAIKNKSIIKSDAPSSKVICPPIHSAKPLVVNPCANAKPPPKSNRIPQGNLTASFQLISFLFFSLDAGKINNIIPEITAIIVSSILGIIFTNPYSIPSI